MYIIMENYILLLNKNEELQNEIYRLKDTINEQEKLLKNNDKKIHKLEYDGTNDIKSKIAANYGYFLYAYQYENMRFVCSVIRKKDYNGILRNLKGLYPSEEMIYQEECSYPLTEKNMLYFLKQKCVSLGQNNFEGSINDIIKTIKMCVKFEEVSIKAEEFYYLEDKYFNYEENTYDELIEIRNSLIPERPDWMNTDGHITYENLLFKYHINLKGQEIIL